MTPANPDALADALAAFLEARFPILRWQAKASAAAAIAGPLAPFLADLQRVTAEYERGLDYRNDLMDRVISLKTSVAAAEARAAQLQAEVEAKDRALRATREARDGMGCATADGLN